MLGHNIILINKKFLFFRKEGKPVFPCFVYYYIIGKILYFKLKYIFMKLVIPYILYRNVVSERLFNTTYLVNM